MDAPCTNCKFYTGWWGKKCNRISNINIRTKKNKPYKAKDAFKICKGYFFEHVNDDLFSCADDALSSSPFFSVELSKDGGDSSP